jgi:hypothetical protein
MRLNLRTRRLTPTVVARIVIAAVLALALLSGVVPLGFTSGRLCQMACCAGMAPHAAGSCSHGSCHIDLSIHKPTPPKQQEEPCGAHKPEALAQHGGMHAQEAPPPIEEDSSATAHQHAQQTGSSGQEQARKGRSQQTTNVAASMLTKPCPPDCGAGICSYSSQSRPRGSAALSHAGRPRPPSSLCLRQTSYNPAKELGMLCRRSRPRGPPLSFS